MTSYEGLLKEEYEQKGWTVLTNGWPDFLLVRGNEIQAVEIKRRGDKVRPEQVEMHKALSKAGLFTFIEREDEPNLASRFLENAENILIYLRATKNKKKVANAD